MKKTEEKNKKAVYGTAVIVVFLGILALCTFGKKDNTSDKIYPEKEISTAGEENTYVVKENGMTYTFYPDGTLLVAGTGATKSFSTPQEAKEWYLTKLYHAYSGWKPEKEEQLLSFRSFLNKVTCIEVAEGVTAIGECSFSPFYFVETVKTPATVKKVGAYAFLGTGQYADNALVLSGLNVSEVEYEPSSFALSAEDIVSEEANAGVLTESGLPVRLKEERGTVPDAELLLAKVSMGNNIEYCLYENGVLYITGTGDTFDFEHYSDAEEHIRKELQLTSRQEAENLWFDRVTEILLEDGIERIGDNAMALYKNVSFVYGGKIKELGRRAFFRMGRDSKEEILWETDFTEAAYENDSFFLCRNLPKDGTKNETR